MHDSRGAALKVGDRVFIEAEITSLATGGDENYCCVDVKVVTPDQPNKEKVMQPPSFSALSTKMLTKIGVALIALFVFATFANAQTTVEEKIQAMKTELQGVKVVMIEHGTQLSAINASQSRMKSDIMDLNEKVDRLEAKLDAALKNMNVTLTKTSTPGWDSATTFQAQPHVLPPNTVPPLSFMPFNSGRMSVMPYADMGSGACAGGSCGAGGAGRGGLFGRRR